MKINNKSTITKFELNKPLVRFLESKNALDSFLFNVNNLNVFNDSVKDGGKITIRNAFVWGSTKEGEDYWRNLYDQYFFKI